LLNILFALHYVHIPWLSSVFFTIAVLAGLIAIILNSYNLAYLDELTHLPTRRALKQHMNNLGRRYSLAVVDIDFFKKINDNYGHDVGDQVLRMVAGHLRKVHGGGKAYRFGGEEFVIVFQGKDAGEAMLMLESLRERVANKPFIQRSRLRPKNKPNKPRQRAKVQHINVTISIGVAERSTHHDSAQDVLKSADKALYKAKKTGRNKVVA
jgi:diguanylate cyclase (GGDEF)-like protein